MKVTRLKISISNNETELLPTNFFFYLCAEEYILLNLIQNIFVYYQIKQLPKHSCSSAPSSYPGLHLHLNVPGLFMQA